MDDQAATGRARRWLHDFGEGVLELLFPSAANCLGCASPIGAEIGWLCAECDAMLMPISRMGLDRCPRCGCPLAGRKRCKHCRAWPTGGVSSARYAYFYGRPMSGLIGRYKYGGVHRLTGYLGMLLSNAFIAEALPTPDIILPVPMHPLRERERGFNHAELLAGHLARELGVPMPRGALRRVRNTRQQARIASERRGQGLKGAFAATDAVAGLRVLLIDDVITSGDTANHVAQALRAAGAIDVTLLTLAGPGTQNKKISQSMQNQ